MKFCSEIYLKGLQLYLSSTNITENTHVYSQSYSQKVLKSKFASVEVLNKKYTLI